MAEINILAVVRPDRSYSEFRPYKAAKVLDLADQVGFLASSIKRRTSAL